MSKRLKKIIIGIAILLFIKWLLFFNEDYLFLKNGYYYQIFFSSFLLKANGWGRSYYENNGLAGQTRYRNGLRDGEAVAYDGTYGIIAHYYIKETILNQAGIIKVSTYKILSDGDYELNYKIGDYRIMVETSVELSETAIKGNFFLIDNILSSENIHKSDVLSFQFFTKTNAPNSNNYYYEIENRKNN